MASAHEIGDGRRRGPPCAPACTRRGERAFGGSSARNVATSALLPMPISPTTARQTSCPPRRAAHRLRETRRGGRPSRRRVPRDRSRPALTLGERAPRGTGSARARRCASLGESLPVGSRSERQGRRVAPAEVAAHEAVDPARDPGPAGRRRARQEVGEVAAGSCELEVGRGARAGRACRRRCRARCRSRAPTGDGRSSLKPADASRGRRARATPLRRPRARGWR